MWESAENAIVGKTGKSSPNPTKVHSLGQPGNKGVWMKTMAFIALSLVLMVGVPFIALAESRGGGHGWGHDADRGHNDADRGHHDADRGQRDADRGQRDWDGRKHGTTGGTTGSTGTTDPGTGTTDGKGGTTGGVVTTPTK
jgi:hypothetical protein